jgi:hypothetical protein
VITPVKGARRKVLARMYDCRDFRLTPDVTLGLVARFDLHPTTLLVLAALVDHDWPDSAGNRKGVVFPKVERVAALVHRTRRMVQHHLRRLERLGLISCTGNGGRSKPPTIIIHWPTIMGETKPRNRQAWPARETAKRPAHAPKQEKDKKQEPARAAAGCPVGPPLRSGYWEEELPPLAKRRELLAIARCALTGEALHGR